MRNHEERGRVILIMVMMGRARHMTREAAVAEHREGVAERTATFTVLPAGARPRAVAAGNETQAARTTGYGPFMRAASP